MTKTLVIECHESILDKKGEVRQEHFGTATISMRDLIDLNISDSKQISVLNHRKSKSVGTLYIQDCQIKPIFTYMDY